MYSNLEILHSKQNRSTFNEIVKKEIAIIHQKIKGWESGGIAEGNMESKGGKC